MVSVHLLEK